MDILSDNRQTAISLTGNSIADYAIAGACPLLFYILAIYTWGPAITNDSVNYMAAALTLKEGMSKADSTPFFEWPPLFPVLLSLSKILGLNILKYVSWLHGFVLAANCMLTFHLLKRVLQNRIILFFSVLLLAFSVPLLQIHIMVWSEPLFITFILLNILLTKKYLKHPHLTHLLFLISIGILLFLQRKSGFIFSGSTLVLLMIFGQKKIWHWVIYIVLCATPVVWWFWRKQTLSGKFFGDSGLRPEKLIANFEHFFNTFTAYFLPMPFPLIIRMALILIAILILLFLLKDTLRKKAKTLNFYLLTSAGFTLTYYLVILLGLVYVHLSEEIDDRILIPVYPLVLLVVLYLIDLLYSKFSKKPKIKLAFSLILFLWLLYPFTRTMYHLDRWNTTGAGGYNTIYWNNNPLIAHLITISQPNIIYTNHVNAVYYQLNLAREKNIKIETASSKNISASNGLLVCFNKSWISLGENEDCYEDNWVTKELIVETEDGCIWKIGNN